MTRHRILLSMVLSALFTVVAPAAEPDELLPVDDAFVLTANAPERGRIDLRWAIADGYYLYRHRTRVKVLDGGFEAGALQLPDGRRHVDEFFGEVETYRGELAARLPGHAEAHARDIQLEVRYQGCADLGVCYPPQVRTLTVTLPTGASGPVPSSAGADGLAALQRALSGGAPAPGGGFPGISNQPLPPEQAFGFEAIAEDGNTLLLRFTPAPGYYLYRERNQFRLDGADGAALGVPRWPPAQAYHDEHFGEVEVYFDPIDVPVPVIRTDAAAVTATLTATFQGCQDEGICYPPITRVVAVTLPATSPGPAAAFASGGETPVPEGSGGQPASPATSPVLPDASADNLHRSTPPPARDTRLLFALALALLGGLVLNLMPCVLPVLSLKVLGLARSGESRTHARRSALAYTAGVLVTFGAVGLLVIALRSGGQALGWGFQLQQPWFVAALAYVMVAVGLSLSGVFTLGGSGNLGQRLAGQSGAVGDFFTGALACVVASPCIAPFMGGALAYAFAAPAAAALLVFLLLGLGLALPFLLIAFIPAVAGRLPKPGAWMETLKQFLAFPMYLTALWLLWVLGRQRGVDAMALAAVGLVLLALGLWWFERSRWRAGPLMRGLNAALLIIALAPLTLIPLQRSLRPAELPTAVAHEPYDPARLHALRSEGRAVFVNMTADWCVTCKLNEARVLARPAFRRALDDAGAVYMVGDWTDEDPAISAFLERHHAVGVPLYVVYPAGGGEGRVLPAILSLEAVTAALAGGGG